MNINPDELYKNQSPYIRFVIATIIFLVALLLRLLILPVEAGFAFLTFYPATVLGFYLCGIGPGALLVILSAISAYYIFTPPFWVFVHQPKAEIAVTTFLISAYLIARVVHRMQCYATQFHNTLSTLNNSEKRYLDFLEDQTEIICRFDADGVFLYVNDAFCRFFGKPREKLLGRQWHPEAWHEDVPFIHEKLNTLSPANPVVTIENRVIAAGGSIHWVQFVNRAFFDAEGRLQEMQSVGRDINEQKKAQSAMDQLYKLINHISSRVPGIIFQYQLRSDGSSCFPYASEAIHDIFHVAPEEVKENAAAIFLIIHPEDYGGLIASVRQSANTLESWQHEFRVRYLDGTSRWLYGNALPERAQDDSLHWYGFITDITERKEIEQTLRFLSVAVEQSPMAVIIADTDARIQYANAQFAAVTGYCREEVLGKNPRIFQSGLTHSETYKNMWDTISQGQVWHGELINIKKNGEKYWEESHIAPIFNDLGRITHYVSLKLDITEQKKLQNSLRESQELFSKIFHASPIGIGVFRLSDNKIIDANTAFQGIIGHTREDLIGLTDIEMGLWSDLDCRNKMIAQFAQQGSVQNFEVEFRRNAQETLSTLQISMESVEIAGEQCLLSILIDITERKELEKKLIASANEIQDLYDHAPCGYHSIDPNGVILSINQTELDWLGYSREEVIGKLKIIDFFTAAGKERFQRSFPRFLKDGHIENLEFELIGRNGTIRTVSVSASAIRDEIGNFVMSRSVIYDISELKKVQEALMSMDRRKDEFLAMLAHELRNPLAPIRNAALLLKRQKARDPILKKSYEVIDRQVTQLSRLLDDLLDVARIRQDKIILNIKPVLLNEIVELAVESCQPLIDSRRQKLIITLPMHSVWINGDSARLTQVLSNLLNNAAKYTDEEGEISLSATCDSSLLTIQVKDSGIGIAPEILPHIFDLFTQANQGLAHSQGGIGLGLTLVRRLLEFHGGTVTAESAGTGCGSLFTVRLPVLSIDPTIDPALKF